MLININPDNPQLRLIQQVVEHLQAGAIICYPTDTGYGVGCDLFHQKAIKRLMQIKKRPEGKPFSFMCSSLKNISEYAHVSNTAYRLMKKNLPGAYTFVLPGSKIVPKIMATKQKTVGIRVPANPICLLLLETLGHPIVNTSIPVESKLPVPTEAYEIEEVSAFSEIDQNVNVTFLLLFAPGHRTENSDLMDIEARNQLRFGAVQGFENPFSARHGKSSRNTGNM